MTQSAKPGNDSLFQKLSFLLILASISLTFLYMVRPFLMTVLMASVFTGLSYPLYTFFFRRFKKPALASLSTLLIFVLLILLPISLVVTVAYHEATSFLNSEDFAALPGRAEKWIREVQAHFPVLFSRMGSFQDPHQGLQQAVAWILKKGANWSVTAASSLVQLALMLFVMFYLFIDGKRIMGKIRRWSPLRSEYEVLLIRRFLAVSRGTLMGVLAVGTVQGTIGTLLFWIVGLHSPILLGILMIFCSILPAVGTALIWGSVAVFLFAQGRPGAAIAVIAVGGGVISTIDNILRVMLVGKNIKMHDLMVLLSTLGGLALFGLPGFIIGPILGSLFLSIWNMYEEVFAEELARNRTRVKKTEE